jgi:hypothetical protein
MAKTAASSINHTFSFCNLIAGYITLVFKAGALPTPYFWGTVMPNNRNEYFQEIRKNLYELVNQDAWQTWYNNCGAATLEEKGTRAELVITSRATSRDARDKEISAFADLFREGELSDFIISGPKLTLQLKLNPGIVEKTRQAIKIIYQQQAETEFLVGEFDRNGTIKRKFNVSNRPHSTRFRQFCVTGNPLALRAGD